MVYKSSIVAIEKDSMGNIIRGTDCGIEFTATFDGRKMMTMDFVDGLKYWFGYDQYGNRVYSKNSNGYESFNVFAGKKVCGKIIKRLAYYCDVYNGEVFYEWGEEWAMEKYGKDSETPLYKNYLNYYYWL